MWAFFSLILLFSRFIQFTFSSARFDGESDLLLLVEREDESEIFRRADRKDPATKEVVPEIGTQPKKSVNFQGTNGTPRVSPDGPDQNISPLAYLAMQKSLPGPKSGNSNSRKPSDLDEDAKVIQRIRENFRESVSPAPATLKRSNRVVTKKK